MDSCSSRREIRIFGTFADGLLSHRAGDPGSRGPSVQVEVKAKHTEAMHKSGARDARSADRAADSRQQHAGAPCKKTLLQGATRFQPSARAAGIGSPTRSLGRGGDSQDHYQRVLAEFSSPSTLRVRVNAKKNLVCHLQQHPFCLMWTMRLSVGVCVCTSALAIYSNETIHETFFTKGCVSCSNIHSKKSGSIQEAGLSAAQAANGTA